MMAGPAAAGKSTLCAAAFAADEVFAVEDFVAPEAFGADFEAVYAGIVRMHMDA
jgi:hypothetical protein